MNNQAAPFFVDQVWLFPLLILAFLTVWIVVTYSLSRISGWSFLARRFKANDDIEGDKYRFVSASMGKGAWPVKYGNCLFVTVGKAGLYISILVFFRFRCPPLLIPWSQIDSVKEDRLLGVFPRTMITVKDSWPHISLRGKAHNAVLDAFNRYSRNSDNQRSSRRNQ